MVEDVESGVKRPLIGVGAVVKRQAECGEVEILMLRRKNVHGEGTWSTPGGHLEWGEDPLTCAGREAEEETAVLANPTGIIGYTNDVFVEAGLHYITLWVECVFESGTERVAADYEMSQVGWFGAASVPDEAFEPFERLRSSLGTQRLFSIEHG